jgi:ubiquinone/menaquinone biosynthesis C-methylase UbiE
MLKPLVRRVLKGLSRPADLDVAPGYDLWSSTYDGDEENLLVALDERMFAGLLQRVRLQAKRVVDVGCGTGRHWSQMLARQPAELIGYDLSPGMLAELRRKYPRATVHEAGADRLAREEDEGCDVVVSTLTLCHVAALDAAIDEWVRVLRPGGDILLTDFHPAAAAVSRCSFRQRGTSFTIKHHVHSLASLKAAAARNRLELLALDEAMIDESSRPYFERADMLPVFETMKGMPLVYGAHFRKPAGAAS